MDDKLDAVRAGVSEAFSENIQLEHDVSTYDASKDGVKEAVAEFLDSHPDALGGDLGDD